ncbi:MAG: hypothetical protein H7145_21610, partial [Akkermansiaceae bacterium]|nr:hypothetical protein [Armatimonadota bacterium]
DLGGIYTYAAQPNTLIDNNSVHHVNGDYDAFGVYNDQGSRDITISNNVLYRNKSSNYFSWLIDSGYTLTLRNNILANSPESQLRVGYFNGNGVVNVSRNLVYYAGGGDQEDPTAYGNAFWYGFNETMNSNNNLFFSTTGRGIWARSASSGSFDVDAGGGQWYDWGFDRNSIFVDPLFVNPAADDYRLQPSSPGGNIGFDAGAIKYDFGARY